MMISPPRSRTWCRSLATARAKPSRPGLDHLLLSPTPLRARSRRRLARCRRLDRSLRRGECAGRADGMLWSGQSATLPSWKLDSCCEAYALQRPAAGFPCSMWWWFVCQEISWPASCIMIMGARRKCLRLTPLPEIARAMVLVPLQEEGSYGGWRIGPLAAEWQKSEKPHECQNTQAGSHSFVPLGCHVCAPRCRAVVSSSHHNRSL